MVYIRHPSGKAVGSWRVFLFRRWNWRFATIGIVLSCVLLWEMVGPRLWLFSAGMEDPAPGMSRLLLVADPQLQGFHNEPSGGLGMLTRWDAYKYVRKYVRAVYYMTKPEQVVFMGDLLDEGSTASDDEFASYAYRFHQIFPWSVMPWQLFVAGDNDIGGEDGELLTAAAVTRFEKYFRPVNGNKTTGTGVPLVWFNSPALAAGYSVEPSVREAVLQFINSRGAPLRPVVLFSHLPLQRLEYSDVKQLLQGLNVATVFSSHEHCAYTTTHSKLDSTQLDEREPFPPGGRFVAGGEPRCYADNKCILEVTVPTASYRMGVDCMAVAVVDIDTVGKIQQMVMFEFPARYPVLLLYAVLAVLAAVLLSIRL